MDENAEVLTDDRHPKTTAHPLQFSLRAMLLTTAAVAVACSVFFGLPDVLAFPVVLLLLMAFPSLLIVLIVYGRRGRKAFAIGAIFPAGLTAFVGAIIVLGSLLTDWNRWLTSIDKMTPILKIYTGSMFACSLAAGFVAFCLWWILERQRKSEG